MFMHEDEHEDDIMETIKKLMEELTQKMEYSSDDFEERLGRKKPDVSVSVIKGEMPKHDMEEEAEEMPDMDADDSDEDMDHGDEGDMLKDRLMKLRRG